MKWGKVIEQNIVWEWRRHYISYKALKKIIRQLKNARKRDDYEEHNQLEFAFNALVEQDLDDVESFYELREAQILHDFDSLENEEASNQLYQLEKYAYLNGEGFRKILKKYDKKLTQNASEKFIPHLKTKSFYYHTQIQQLHAKLSRNYSPVVCSYSEEQEREVLLRGNNESVSLHSDYRQISLGEDRKKNALSIKQWLFKHLQLAHHPAIYTTHCMYLLILCLLLCVSIGDAYLSFAFKPVDRRNYLSDQRLKFGSTWLYAFMFPWLIFSLCALIVLMVWCGSGRINWRWSLVVVVSPFAIAVVFGLSPVFVMIGLIVIIDNAAVKSMLSSCNVSYEMMFESQVNCYFYDELLLGNTELIANNYYSFSVYALRILFLSILHLYRIDAADDDIKHMYLSVINRFVSDDVNAIDVDCLQLMCCSRDFYFAHSNNDQPQSSWKSLVTSFQSYCILLFGMLCFVHILWWISFGWSASNLFHSFAHFTVLLRIWAIRDALLVLLCGAYVAVRRKYMYYVMLYDYSWFHQDLRYMILDNLVVNQRDNPRRKMKFEQRFDSKNNSHCKFVMDHLMPILRHSQIKHALTDICFHQSWMVNLIMTYSCDFGVYVVVPKPNDMNKEGTNEKSALLAKDNTITIH